MGLAGDTLNAGQGNEPQDISGASQVQENWRFFRCFGMPFMDTDLAAFS
jgi:hypothetical protein